LQSSLCAKIKWQPFAAMFIFLCLFLRYLFIFATKFDPVKSC